MDIKRLEEYHGTMVLGGLQEVPILQYEQFQKIDFITHAFSTRMGGVSKGIYASMNFKEDGEDTNENIRANYRKIARSLECDVNKMVRSQLCHGTRVHKVSPEDFGTGALAKSTLLDYDGLITDIEGVTLVATFADCVPLYFIDQEHKAIGLAHSGWRGTVERIALAMMDSMNRHFGTKPEHLFVGIGPCICSSCYEVSEDLREAFSENFSGSIEEETGIKFADIFHETNQPGKYLLDLRLANKMTFLHAGLTEEQIMISDVCTCCNPELIFSHRYTKGRRGASAAFLGIRE